MMAQMHHQRKKNCIFFVSSVFLTEPILHHNHWKSALKSLMATDVTIEQMLDQVEFFCFGPRHISFYLTQIS